MGRGLVINFDELLEAQQESGVENNDGWKLW